MEKEILRALRNSGMMRNASEIETYESNLETLSETFSDDDVAELLSTFEDDTENEEVMFGAVHLLETLSSEKAFGNLVKGTASLFRKSPEWAMTIIRRCLNDEVSVPALASALKKVDAETAEGFGKILEEIGKEDEERFGEAVGFLLRTLDSAPTTE